MRGVVPWLLFPVLFGGALTAMGVAARTSIGLEGAFVATTAALFLVLTVLERVVPWRAAWTASDGQLGNDLLHGAVGSVLGSRAATAFNELVVALVAARLVGAADLSASPVNAWPLVVQVAIAVIVVDLGRYLQHRALHRVPWLWRLHTLHHDSRRLTVWKGGRAHVVERVLQGVCMFLPVALLGFSREVAVWAMAVHSFSGSIAHANVDVRLGVFGGIVNGPEQHRIHHSRTLVEGNANLGSALVVFDRLFGTYLDPRARPAVGDVGVSEATPAGFFAQLASPFVRRARVSG